MKPSIRISITGRPVRIANLASNVKRAKFNAAKEMKTMANGLQRFTIKTMKTQVPVNTGRLQRSIKTIVKTDTGYGGDVSKSTREVGPTVRYSGYVTRGTGPSPGQFIPVLKKRISRGFHPGTPANDFVARTRTIVEADMTRRLKEATRKAGKAFIRSYLGGKN